MAAQNEQHLYSVPYDRVQQTTNSYAALTDKPSINGVELQGDKSLSQLGIPTHTSQLTNDSGFITESAVPTKTSELTNDSGFITSANIPTKTSDLTNDSGFITSADVPTKTSELTNDSDFTTKTYVDNHIPTKTSDLTNDSGFITAADVPTKTSELTNDSGFITTANIPTKTSDLTNDSDFTTKTYVDNQLADKQNKKLTAISGSVGTVNTNIVADTIVDNAVKQLLDNDATINQSLVKFNLIKTSGHQTVFDGYGIYDPAKKSVRLYLSTNTDSAVSSATMATIPADYRPSTTQYMGGLFNGSTIISASINTSGAINQGQSGTFTSFIGFAEYII